MRTGRSAIVRVAAVEEEEEVHQTDHSPFAAVVVVVRQRSVAVVEHIQNTAGEVH